MTSINQAQDEIIDEFSLFDEWSEKYEYLIDLGKKLPSLAAEHKIEANVIKGCQSVVWLHAEFREGRVYFAGDSEAIIVKGLIALLIRVLSGRFPEVIVNAELYFIDRIGMSQHLAQTRSNGLYAMLKQMKFYAMAFGAKQSS